MTKSFSDVTNEDKFFFAQADNEKRIKKQTLQRKKQAQKNVTEWVTNEETSSMKPSIKVFARIDESTTSFSRHGIRAIARIRLEEDVY